MENKGRVNPTNINKPKGKEGKVRRLTIADFVPTPVNKDPNDKRILATVIYENGQRFTTHVKFTVYGYAKTVLKNALKGDKFLIEKIMEEPQLAVEVLDLQTNISYTAKDFEDEQKESN